MKNTKLILALVAPLLLSGCNGSSKKVSFKDNLEYERELSVSEEAALGARVQEKLLEEGKKVSVKGEGYQEVANIRVDMKSVMEAELFNDYYAYEKTEQTATLKQNGITTVRKTTELRESFIDSSRLAVVDMTTTSGDREEFDLDYNKYLPEDAEETKEAFNYYAISNFLDVFDEGNIYAVKGGGYAVVGSFIQEQREDVSYGAALKQYVLIQREQTVIRIDKNYKITTMEGVQEYVTNRDPMTGEWFKNEKTVLYTKSTGSFTYGKRAAAGNKLANAQETVGKEVLNQLGVDVAYGQFNPETRVFTVSGSIGFGSSNYKATRTAIDRYHVEATFTIPSSENIDAFGIGVGCVRRENYAADDLSVNKFITLEGLDYTVDSNDNTIMRFEAGKAVSVIISFDAVAAHGGVSIENLEQHVY